jgi:hypothetical protein
MSDIGPLSTQAWHGQTFATLRTVIGPALGMLENSFRPPTHVSSSLVLVLAAICNLFWLLSLDMFCICFGS